MAQKEDRRIGTIIGGKWRVDGLLGTGSMAAVYAVTHRNGVHAALKILHPTLCTDAAVCERFLGEGYLTNSVKHPGIVRVLDDGMTDDGCVFLVMDLLDGKTLEALRQDRGGKIPIEETLDIADALMDALIAVHSAGIIHRDLKPQNVFICANGDVKLLDFGVARILETTKASNKMSLFGMVLGTPSFMSPEQAIGARDHVDHRADVWSLAATLFTALTGETVHLGPHVQARLLAAGTVQARSISVVAQDLPPAIASVIDTALRFDKADRFQSVEAFRRALREARDVSGLGEPMPVSSVAPSFFPKSIPPRRKSSAPPSAKGTKRRSQYPKAIVPTEPTNPTDAQPDESRKRTFMGIGSPNDAVPPAKRTLPYGVADVTDVLTTEELAAHRGAAAALPVAIIKKPIAVDSTPAVPPTDTADASYPAVHTPVRFDTTDALISQLTTKRSPIGFWLVSVALVALAVGGVAFFAMGTQTEAPDAAAAAAAPPAPATLTSAAAPQAPAPASSGIVIGDPAVPAPPATEASATKPAPHAAITPPSTWRPRWPSRNSSASAPVSPTNPSTSFPRSTVDPPASTPAPAATPTLAPDPFSTPE